jgi:hypothetical protein
VVGVRLDAVVDEHADHDPDDDQHALEK